MAVRVRFPSGAQKSLLEEIPRGIFVLVSGLSVARISLSVNRLRILPAVLWRAGRRTNLLTHSGLDSSASASVTSSTAAASSATASPPPGVGKESLSENGGCGMVDDEKKLSLVFLKRWQMI